MRNKRGQELSLNTIIIAVIIVVVLVVVVAFFLFGFKGLTDQVKKIFFGTTAGTDRTLAIQQCRSYCDQLELIPESAWGSAPYCNLPFNIDMNNDGDADFVQGTKPKEYINYYCFPGASNTLSIDCSVRREGILVPVSCPAK